jgi:large subunit ribosomal protein L5
MSYTPRLKKKYAEEIIPALMQEFQFKNQMQVPKLLKISLNQGVGAAITDKKIIESALEEMTLVSGQKAVSTKSKKGHFELQAQAGYANWRKGHTAW